MTDGSIGSEQADGEPEAVPQRIEEPVRRNRTHAHRFHLWKIVSCLLN
jgi:hypothetical protein